MDKPLVAQIREAVSSGEYERASQLWSLYAEERFAEVHRGCGDKLPEMRELMEWTRVVVLCARAQALRTIRTRLTEVHAADAYVRTAH
jgi:hypothetical protein